MTVAIEYDLLVLETFETESGWWPARWKAAAAEEFWL